MSQELSMGMQRSKMKMYEIGDVVEVFSLKSQKWILDGEIADLVKETCVKDGFKIRAGSIKVLYENATRFKWVAPQNVPDHIRRSARVKPPPHIMDTMEIEVSLWESV